MDRPLVVLRLLLLLLPLLSLSASLPRSSPTSARAASYAATFPPPRTSSPATRRAGDAAFRADNFPAAEDLYRLALQENPSDVQALANLATTLYHGRIGPSSRAGDSVANPFSSVAYDVDQVASLYRRALALAPRLPTLWYNLGSTLLHAIGQLPSDAAGGEQEAALSDEAMRAFERALALRPHFPAALQNLGALQQELGLHNEAEASFRAALASRSTTSTTTGSREKAGVEKDNTRSTKNARANLFAMLKAKGKTGALEDSYREALRVSPDDADVHADLGALMHNSNLGGREKIQAALGHYRDAVALDPNHRAHVNIGIGLLHLHSSKHSVDNAKAVSSWVEEALFHFRRGLQGSEHLRGLAAPPVASLLYAAGQHNSKDEASSRPGFLPRKRLALLRSLTGAQGRMTCGIARKLLHDAEQIEFVARDGGTRMTAMERRRLRRVGRLFTRLATAKEAGGRACPQQGSDQATAADSALATLAPRPPPRDNLGGTGSAGGSRFGLGGAASSGGGRAVDVDLRTAPVLDLDSVLSDEEQVLVEGSWRKVLFMHPASPSLSSSRLVLNPAVLRDADGAQDIFDDRQLLVVDDVLSREALAELRQHLLRSTIWNAPHPHAGYVGTTIAEGIMSHRVTVELGAALSRAYPRIFCKGRRRVKQVWAYSYHNFDGVKQGGIGVHADASAVNANLWIGSLDDDGDDGDLKEGENGLVVHAKEAPLDWEFAEYNNADDSGQRAKLTAFLEDAPWYNVRYRSNRLVLFNANFFHESMPLRVQSGFARRRINLTFLFGERGAKCAAPPKSRKLINMRYEFEGDSKEEEDEAKRVREEMSGIDL